VKSNPWSPASRADWEVLQGKGYLPLTQAWEWGEAKQSIGGRVERWTLDGHVGVQIQYRRGIAWAAGAPLGEIEEDIAATLRALAGQLRRPLLLSPSVPVSGLGRAVGDLFHSGTVLFDVSGGEAAARARLHKNWRNHLSKAERAGTEVTEGSVQEFLAMVGKLGERKGFTIPYDGPFVNALRSSFGSGFTLRIARHRGRAVGGWLDLRAGTTATYFMGATPPDGRAVRASYLLGWDAFRRHGNSAGRLYDLGGIGSDRSTGPAAFKVRTGGRVVEFPGTFLVGTGPVARLAGAILRLRGSRDPSRGTANHEEATG
jgi:hypothetical protein